MNLKYILFAIVIILSVNSQAQETSIYKDAESLYKLALQHYNLQLYTVAQKEFRQFEKNTTDVKDAQLIVYRKNAAYYSAMIALQLLQPGFEKTVNDFADANLPDQRAFDAKLKLANYYFEKKDFKKAAEIFDNIDESNLNNIQSTEYKFKKSYLKYTQKEYTEAKEGFKQLTTYENPYQSDAQYYTGVILLNEKNDDKALAYFEKSKQTDKYKKEVPKYIAQIYFNKENYTDVIKTGEEAFANDASDKEGISMLMALAYYKTKRYAEALPVLENYVNNARKTSPTLIYTLAMLQLNNNQCNKAIDNLKELATKSDSLGQNAQYHLAQCYIKTNQKSSALNAYKAAFNQNFDKEIQQKSMFEYGKLAYEMNNDAEALNTLQQYTKKYNQSDEAAEANEIITSILINSNNYAKAIETIEQMPTLKASMKKAYQRLTYLRAIELLKNNDVSNAEIMLNNSLKYTENAKLQSNAYFWLGDIAYNKKQYTTAINNYSKYITNYSSNEIYNDESSLMAAYYGIAYSHFNQEKYSTAIKNFEKALTKDKTIEDEKSRKRLIADTYSRLGDAYFISKNYAKANENYANSLQPENPSYDYCQYQQAIIFGLLGKNEEKLTALQNIYTNYPKSSYADDALLQSGNTYFEQNRNTEAETQYQSLITKYPKSPIVREAYLRLGLLNYNQNKNDKAISYYKKVVENYPNTVEANEALNSIKDIYVEKGNSKEYIDYVSKIKGNISTNAQDTLIYQVAEKRFLNGNYKEAQQDFENYIAQFKNGAFTTNAHFYLAECNYFDKNYNNALKEYQFVLAQKNNQLFIEKSNGRSALLYLNNKDYAKANTHFKNLYELSSSNESKIDALKGLMRTFAMMKKYDESAQYANELMQDKTIDESVHNEIKYVQAISHFQQNNWEKANELFTELSQLNNETAAESRYYLASILYKQNKANEAKQACINLANDMPTYEYWVVKSFLLMSDIFKDEKDYFQAKQTLQSIIENFDNAELKRTAEEKLKEVEMLEKENSKIDNEGN